MPAPDPYGRFGHRRAAGGGEGLVTNAAPEFFRCSQCHKRFRWKPEAAGRTIRCKCGVKVRCPAFEDGTMTAGESLDDTVADVTLDEAFDTIETAAAPEGAIVEPQVDFITAARQAHRGVFGLRPPGETLFWGVVALLCVGSSILALIVGKWFYIVAAALTLWGALRFYRSWTNWRRGRPWLECLAEAFGEQDGAAGA